MIGVGSWRPVRRLAGGSGDRVYLVADGPARAVLKIKHGGWWAEQLGRTVDVVADLRRAGYPTPAVLDHGSLAGDRSYLLTDLVDGTRPHTLPESALTDLLAAVGTQAAIRPPAVRDWSVMITLFLNGDGAEFAYHPEARGLADRALALLGGPVPALPGGEFVHGDLTTRNLLVADGGLRGVIDVEGFGRGTRTIDLVAMLSFLPDPLVDRVRAAAIAASDLSVFRACVVHRVLAGLVAATEQPDQLPDATARATRLLSLAR